MEHPPSQAEPLPGSRQLAASPYISCPKPSNPLNHKQICLDCSHRQAAHLDGLGWLAADGEVGGPSPAPHTAAPAVEQDELDAVSVGNLGVLMQGEVTHQQHTAGARRPSYKHKLGAKPEDMQWCQFQASTDTLARLTQN